MSIKLKIPILFLALLVLMSVAFSHDASAGTIIKAPAYLGLQNGLVGCWNFDGSYTKVPDCSGNNNTGTLTNGPTKVAGKVGQALNFDGANNNLVNMGTPTVLNDLGPMTVSAWIKPGSLGSNRSIATKATGAGYWVISLGSGGDLYFGKDAVNDLEQQSVNGSVSVGVWQHIILTWDGSSSASNVKFYVNGTETSYQYSADAGGSFVSDVSLSFRIGNTSNNNGFNGAIDEVRIYNRALSANEISRLHRIGLGSTANRTSTSLDKGLVGHWTFDGPDVSGNIAKDRSGQSNNATFANGMRRVAGKIGQAHDCANIAETDNIPDPANGSLDFGTGSFSVGMWMYWRGLTGAFDVPWEKGGYAAGAAGYDVEFSSGAGGTIRLGLADGDELQLFATLTNNAMKNRWMHFFAVVDRSSSPGTVYLYLDGSQAPSSDGPISATMGSVSGANSATICNLTGENGYDGLLDDVRVYNRALSVGEIQRLYNSTQSTFNSSKTGDVLTNGLVGHWTFDGPDISGTRAKDRSVSNNHGTITSSNTSPEIAIGKIGQAIDFTNTDDNYVVTANSVTLSNGTISAWIKYRALNASEDAVVAFNGAGGCAGAAGILGRSPGEGFTGNGFGIYDGAWKIASTGVDPIPGVWYHILGTWGSGGIKFYENGVFKASDPETNGFTNEKLTMGVANCPNDLQGVVDDVRLYNRALSAGEINKLYQMGR